MAVTINDVAKRAGVSHTTVSWVIHDDPRITQKTREKVLKAIEELDYHPNYSARSLVKGKTDTIAVVANFFSTYFELSILKGIEQGLDESSARYNINLFSARDKNDETLKEILYGKRADAVIMLSENPSESVLNAYRKQNTPIVLVETFVPDEFTIKTDNIHGARLAMEYLIKSGKKRIGIIVEEQHYGPGHSQIERFTGYKKVLEENNIPFDKDLVFELEHFHIENGKMIARDIAEKKLDVDAIFCAAGDKVAMGFLVGARESGLKVPEDIAIVGFDDIDVASLVTPPLSTVKQNLDEIGRVAYKMAVEAIEGREVPDPHIEFQPELIVRGSA